MKRTLIRLGLSALITSALFGCGGGGSDGVSGTASTPVTVTTTGPGINPAIMTAAQWASMEPIGTINSVTTNGQPVVTFTLTDASGNAIVGLEKVTSQSATAKYPSYPNLGFTIAKLMPASNGSPSRWISYEVFSSPTITADVTVSRPGTENYGVLEAVTGVPGQYKYTFRRDPNLVKQMVGTTAGFADLDDLTYDPSLTHRVGIQFSGAARGTGSNTSSGAASGVDQVVIDKPVNFFYDFIPATGRAVVATDTQREIVSVASCFECHSKFVGFHGGDAVNKLPASRQDTKMCVLCHTDQRKFGRAGLTTIASNGNFSDNPYNSTTGVTTYTKPTYTIDGLSTDNNKSIFDLPLFVHKIHMGEKLTRKGYLAGAVSDGVRMNEVKYPQTITNCVKCHDGTPGAKNQTAQGDNWKTQPSRLACGACHDAVNFETGANHPSPVANGVEHDDSRCANCHNAADISTVYHTTVDPTGSVDRGGYPNPPSGVGNAIALASMVNPPASVYKIAYEIKSVTVDSTTKFPTVEYRIMKNGAAVPLKTATGPLLDNLDGTPSIYVTYGVPQDGVTKVVDWTASLSATVTQFRDAQFNSIGTANYSQSGPDASGYYKATFKSALPTGYAMVYGAVGINYQGFVQLTGYKVNGVDVPIRLRESAFALKAASATDTRRPIVAAANCNNCHGQLGVEPSFHSGARNNPEGCAMGGCHMETKATGHTDGGAWALSEKYMVHGIHGGWKRTIPFTYAASSGEPKGFSDIEYPGVLQNCRQCHLPGSFDFSNAVNANAVQNMLWTTDTALDLRLPPNNSAGVAVNPSGYIGLSPWIKGGDFASNKAAPTVLDRHIVGLGYKDYRIDNAVSSPTASACFGCHDAAKSINHMEQNGGVLVKQISTVTGIPAPVTTGLTSAQIATALTAYRGNLTAANKEACLICHGTGKVADIRVVHGVK
ncbi:MAG: hypothetical protein CGW95_05840 [Phenylobacterium zucineum]|nr:MAG: hypothetical protein CGW95_05840 [Phenylobacterium zucineum]